MVGDVSRNGDNGQQTPQDNLPDTSPVDRLIQTTRRWLRSTWVTTGAGLTIGLLLTTLVAVALADLALTLWPSMRLVGMLLIVIPTSVALIVGVIRPLFRGLNRVLVARRIEREIPGIHNRLVSCVDFTDNDAGEFHSMAFHRRLVNEAVERIRDFRLQKVIDMVSLRRSGIFSAVGLIAILLTFTVFSNRLSTAVARIFQPFADIPPASGVLYDVLLDDQQQPGDYETLRGERVDFRVVLRQGEVDPPGGDDPLRLEVHTVDEDGAPKQLRYEFGKLQDKKTSFQLTGMQESFTYRVYGGGTWTKEMKVTMLDRPRIVGLQTVLHYPEYMNIREPRYGAPQTVDVTGPKESTVEILLDVEGDPTEGEIQLLQMQTKTVDVLNRPPRKWFGDQMPSGAAADGKWEFDEKLIGAKGHTDAANKAVHAHGFHGAPIGFEVLPGESLFADVYLVPDQVPETIMLKWHDGQGWEHRAYWGADKIQEGKPETPSRFHAGDLPRTGKLVRLEVPAKSLDLEGKRLHGVSFALFGGKCVWGETGTLPAAQKQVQQLTATESVLLQRVKQTAEKQQSSETRPASAQKWRGQFSLMREGFYRVVLRNKLKDPNQQMQEGKLTPIYDQPPQVAIERPGTDLLLSTPVKVPIYISAFDDFGIDVINISVQHGENASFQGRTVKKYKKPQRSDTTVVTLDLAEEQLKVGDTLRYRVEVRDRRDQTASTRDYSIRLADDNQAADRQFAEFEKKTDTFQEKLVKLIAEQNKVQETVEKLTEKYKPVSEKLEQAKAEAVEKLAKADPAKPIDPQTLKPEDVAKATELDADTTKALAELRSELGEVAKLENQNLQLGKQVASELAELSKQAPNQQMLPPEVAQQLDAVQKAFQQMAVQPLDDLNSLMQKGTQAANKDPQLAQVQDQGKDLQQNLQDLKQRMDALAKAQTESQNDIDKALADLRKDLTRQNAQMTANELADLKNFLEAMRKDLKNLQGVQEELLSDNAQNLSDRLFEKLKEEQEQLDKQSEQELAEARDVLDSEQLRRLRDQPRFPNRPYDPERGEYLVPPKEQDTAEPEGEDDKKDGKKQEDGKQEPQDADAEDEDPPLFMPALGGEIPKLDPRFKDKIRKLAEAAKRQNKPDSGEQDPRQELRNRQASRVEELDLAEQALNSDQKSLEQMLEQLQAAAADPQQAEQLGKMMKSMSMQQAQAMLERMRQMQAQAQQQQNQQQNQQANQTPPPTDNPQGLLKPTENTTEAILVELDDLDINTRTVIMKLQPKVREELLQGLREEGPEGYRRFIRDYFRRLTKVNATPQK